MQKKKDLGTITWHEVQVGNESHLCIFKMSSLPFQISSLLISSLFFNVVSYILRFLLILQVLVFFIILILLWFFQSPKFIPGWADQFKASGERNHKIFVSFITFSIPALIVSSDVFLLLRLKRNVSFDIVF
jgi:hypothetical protein